MGKPVTDTNGSGQRLDLTKTNVERLVADPAGNRYYPIGDKGLGMVLQVTPKGMKSFVLRYRTRAGKQKMHTLGRWPGMNCDAAKAAATTQWVLINAGEDPNAVRAETKAEERRGVTVDQLAQRFIKEHIALRNKPSTALVHGRYIERDIKPGLGRLKVKMVSKTDIAELLFRIQAEGKSTKAYTVARILSKMFAKAELWGIIPPGTNPARGQDVGSPRKRSRRLSDQELFALGKVLRENKTGEDIYALSSIRLYLLTGMRRSELLGDVSRGIPPLTWNQVDLAAGVLILPHHKTDQESGQRTVLLCRAAVSTLRQLNKAKMIGNPCVIPGAIPGRARANIHLSWDRLRIAAKIPDVRLHDLRRTFISVGADLGLPDYFADAQVGHAPGTVTDVYRRVGANPLFDAVETIGGRIEGLLTGSIDPKKETKARAKAQAKAGKNA